MKNTKHQKGFTLIEILIVVAVIGMMSAVILVSLAQARLKARDAKRKSELVQLQKAVEIYYNANNGYPSTGLVWGGLGTCPDASKTTSGANSYIPGLTPTYVTLLPTDPKPKTSGCTGYSYKSDGTNYKIVNNAAETFPAAGEFFYDVCRPAAGIMITNNSSVTANAATCVSGGW